MADINIYGTLKNVTGEPIVRAGQVAGSGEILQSTINENLMAGKRYENGQWVPNKSEVVNNLTTNSTDAALSAAMGKELNDNINSIKEYREMSIDFGKYEDTVTIAIMQPSIISGVKLVNVSKLLLSYDGQTQQEYESGQIDLGDSDYLALDITRINDATTAVVGLTLKNANIKE